ncbi:MAG: hypothetical protein AAFZ18_38215 [Myxococcota bacterium]
MRAAPCGAWSKPFGESFLRVRDGQNDRVYGFESFPTSRAAVLDVLRGRPTARVTVEPWTALAERDIELSGRLLALPPEVATSVARTLAHLVDSERAYRIDPFTHTGTLRIAGLLDEAMDGALSAQAALNVNGNAREWALDRLRGSPAAWLVELLVAGDGGRHIAWDTVTFPDGLERILDRGTLAGSPIVAARYGSSARPASQTPIPSALALLLPLAALGILWPRFAAVVGGAAVGLLGLTGVFLSWGFIGAELSGPSVLAALLPTHLLLALLAFSKNSWSRLQPLVVLYLVVALLLAVGVTAGGLMGRWTMPPLSAVVAGGSFAACLLVGIARSTRRARRMARALPAVRPRAQSFIEKNDKYVGQGGGIRFR